MSNRSEGRWGRKAGQERKWQNDDISELIVDFSDGQPVYSKKSNSHGYREQSGSYGRHGKDNARKNGQSQYARGGKYEPNERGGRRNYGEPRQYGERRHADNGDSGFRDRKNFDRRPEPKNGRHTDAGSREAIQDMRPRAQINAQHSVAGPEQERDLPNIIMGRNPVKEAIRSGRSIDRLLISKERDGSLNELLNLARDAKLVIREVDRAKLDEICMPFGHNGRTGNHQGIVAEIPGVEYCEIDDILACARDRDEAPFIIMLDGIEDPHNLGSIIRSAECAGAHGVVITKRRCAPVTAAVVKTSAGAVEHMHIARVVNLSVTIDRLKREGLWIVGADMAGTEMSKSNLKGPLAIVIGGEGGGLTRLVKEKCDLLTSVPIKGRIESLNASVAAAVIMFEKNRQDLVAE